MARLTTKGLKRKIEAIRDDIDAKIEALEDLLDNFDDADADLTDAFNEVIEPLKVLTSDDTYSSGTFNSLLQYIDDNLISLEHEEKDNSY